MQHQQAIKVLCKLDPIIFWCNANDMFFVHTSLVNSLLFYFCACYFVVLVSKWLLCIFFFCTTNQIFCAYIQSYQLPTIVYSTVHIQLYKLTTVPGQVRCTNTSTGKELIVPTSLGQGCEMLTFVFDQLSKLLFLFSLFHYYSLGQGCEKFTFFLDQLKFWHLMHW